MPYCLNLLQAKVTAFNTYTLIIIIFGVVIIKTEEEDLHTYTLSL